MVDRKLGQEIRRLVDESVPPAPWLENRVMAAVLEQASGRSFANSRPERVGFRLAALAAMLIAILAIGVLLGSRLSSHPNPSPAGHLTPSTDPAIVAYRAVIDRDMNFVRVNFRKRGACSSPQVCKAALVDTEVGVKLLVSDVSSSPAPAPVAAERDRMLAAARQFIDQLDIAILALQGSGGDFIAAVTAPTISDLDLAVTEVDCWPVVPVMRSDLPEGYGCTSGQ